MKQRKKKISFRLFKAAVMQPAFSMSQRDWHAGQILLYTNPTTKLDHAVLIDFASTTQTWKPDEPNFINNYFGVLRVLLGNEGDVGFDVEVVWKHFGEPDDWDDVVASICTHQWNKQPRLLRARDLFPYISPAWSCISSIHLLGGRLLKYVFTIKVVVRGYTYVLGGNS